jgi:tRNA (pseudouridine54-N1)-methyltransferase
MREFIICAHEAPTNAEFALDDLPASGRLDLLARCLTAALLLSHDVRRSVAVWIVLGDELLVRFEGRDIRSLNPDERSSAALLRAAIAAKRGAIGEVEANPSPGVYVRRGGLSTALSATSGQLVQLVEEGAPTAEVSVPESPVFVLSDHREFTPAERELLTAQAAQQVSLGPRAIHADHAIAIAHNWVDTAGYAQY